MDHIKISMFLSLILRHKPEKIGLKLDANGWAEVDNLIRLANQHGMPVTHLLLEQVVAQNDKKRFAISEDGRRIRASQGHSVEVDLALPVAQPPAFLYHGTASRFIDSIRAGGLHSGSRQHVHLSLNVTTATKVGQRHGRPIVLVIRAGEMFQAGHAFFLSENDVWLTDEVPVEFISFD